MSSSESGTNLNFLQIYPHVEFAVLSRGSFFNTNPDYYNPQSTSTIVEYYIGFSNRKAKFLGLSDFVLPSDIDETISGYPVTITDTLSGASEVITDQMSVVVSGDEEYYLSQTLPQKIQITDPTLDIFETNAQIVYFSTNTASISGSKSEIKTYLDSTYIFTRFDSSTELEEVLFVSNGSETSMTNDVFLREMSRVAIPEFYDVNVTTPQFSGWGCAIVDTEVLYYSYQNPESLFIDEIISTDSTSIKSATNVDFIEYFTSPPIVSINTQPEHIITFQEEDEPLPNSGTASAYLKYEFDYTPLTISLQELDAMENPSVIVFKTDVESNITTIVAMGDLKQLVLNPTDFDEGVLSEFKFCLNFSWMPLLII